MTVTQNTESPTSLPPCRHDSTRIDGSLDSNCLHCGLEGYWHEGHRHDRYHPGMNKVLIILNCEVAKAE